MANKIVSGYPQIYMLSNKFMTVTTVASHQSLFLVIIVIAATQNLRSQFMTYSLVTDGRTDSQASVTQFYFNPLVTEPKKDHQTDFEHVKLNV